MMRRIYTAGFGRWALAVIGWAALAMSATPAHAAPQTRPTNAGDSPLSIEVPEFEVVDATLRQAVEGLAKQARANVAVPWGKFSGSVNEYSTVRVHLWGTTVGGALRVLLTLFNVTDRIAVSEIDGVIYLTPIEDSPDPRSIEIRVYDVRDLLDEAVGYTRSRVEAQSSAKPKSPTATGAMVAPPRPVMTIEEALDALTQIIEGNVETDTWKDNGGATGSLREFGGLLVIGQTRANHRKVSDVLRTIRAGGSREGMATHLFSVTRPAQPAAH